MCSTRRLPGDRSDDTTIASFRRTTGSLTRRLVARITEPTPDVPTDPNLRLFSRRIMDIKELQEMDIHELVEVARGMNIEALSTLRKSELIFKILEGQTEKNGLIYAEGVLQVLAEGYGFLRSAKYNYLPGPDDIYLSPSQIKKFDLKTGDTIAGQVSAAQGQRALFRAAEGRNGQLQGPGQGQEGHAVRQPHAALPGRAVESRAQSQGDDHAA